MKKILLPILLAASAAVWASQKPDGLEYVANLLGFANQAQEHPGILQGTSWPRWSAILTAIAGVALVYGFFHAVLFGLKKMRGPQVTTKV